MSAVVAVVMVAAVAVFALGRLEAGPAQAEPAPTLPTITANAPDGGSPDGGAPEEGAPEDPARVVPVDRCARTTARAVVVDLSEQHLWTCRGGVTVADTPVTTGSDEHPTPTGRWDVYAKQTDRWLSGEGYSRFVERWVPFFRGYGFHDSAWQKIPYGSDRVHEKGSHGCVHVPGDFMKRLYRWIDVGTTVRIVA